MPATACAGPLPAGPTLPEQVLADLVAAAEPGLVVSAGPRRRFMRILVSNATTTEQDVDRSIAAITRLAA